MKSPIFIVLLLPTIFISAIADEIHTSAENGDIVGIQSALDKNPASLTLKDSQGNTPLHSAALKGQLEAVKFLIAKGSPVDIGDNERTTPMQVAAMNGNLEVVKYLVQSGAEVNFVDDNTFTPIRWAAYFGKTEVVKYLISAGANVNCKDRNQQTPMHGASAYGHIETLKVLIDAGGDMETVNRYDFTPLISAIWAGKTESAKLLIDKGANVHYKNPIGEGPLFYASTKGNLELVKILVEKGIDVNIMNAGDWTPLMAAVREGQVEVADYLISQGAEIKHKTARNNVTLLHLAVWSGNASLVKYLINKKLDVNAKNSNDMTPLLTAMSLGNYDLIMALIEGGADVNVKEKMTGNTPLHYTALKGYGRIAQLLLDKGAKVNAKNKKGKIPLYYALKYNHINTISVLTSKGGKLNGNFNITNTQALLNEKLSRGQAILWYLGNCGFAVETQNNFLIFDYFRGFGSIADNPCLTNGYIDPEEIKGKNVLVFVSHEHADHMDESIFGWKNVLPDAQYVFGYKLEYFLRQFRENHSGFEYTYVAPRTTTQVGDIVIRTIKANDAGVGFLVEVDGLKLYHAGDHAGWNEGEREGYTSEIDYLAPYSDNLDVALLNVTGCHAHGEEPLREGTYYSLDKLQPKLMVPTHGMDREEVYNQFVEKMREDGYKVNTFAPEARGDWFIYAPILSIINDI